MGNYFRMSRRFQKSSPEDFGLLPTQDRDVAILPEDRSVWVRCPLYDLGWGAENGYYRSPLPPFPALWTLAVNGDDPEDAEGAAAMILTRHPVELLETCEKLISVPEDGCDFSKAAALFQLERGVNRSPTAGKPPEEVARDAARWKALADFAAAGR